MSPAISENASTCGTAAVPQEGATDLAVPAIEVHGPPNCDRHYIAISRTEEAD